MNKKSHKKKRRTVYFWVGRFEEDGTIERYRRQHFVRATTAAQDEAILDMHTNNPFRSTADTAAQFNQKKRNRGDGRNKENVEESHDKESEEVTEVEETKADDDLCYEIKHSDVMGRYVVASRYIAAGAVIFRERALAVGPCAGCQLVCLGCYRELLQDYQIHKCPGCKWPLCSVTCHGRDSNTGHSAHECRVLATVPPDYGDLDDLKEAYHALMPLRCLLLKESSPSKWAALSAMQSHNELRMARGDIYPMNERNVVDRINKWGLKYDREEIHTVCGILEVNAFEVGGSGSAARALYDKAYLLAHDCTPSTTHTDAGRDPQRPLTVRAAITHHKGDLITLCYAYTLQGTLKRREHIRHSKFFDCFCKRCTDPTELGTYASAFRCPRCSGRVVATTPTDPEGVWGCIDNGCAYTMTAGGVQMLLKRLTDELESIDANDVTGFESFLYKFRNVLHPTHYLSLSAKHSLSQLYGKVEEYMIHSMPESELRRKIDICRDLMQVFDVIEPGCSRLRGVTLYELHAPLMILTTRDFEKKAITKDNLRTRLKEIVGYLSEAAIILGFEPAQSAEGLMASAAKDALTKIKTWEQIIGTIS